MPIAIVATVLVALALAVWAVGPARRRHLIQEIAVIAPAWLAYFLIRGATESDPDAAIARARALAALERDLGIYIEGWLNEALTRSEPLTTVANVVYIWGHWPLIFAVAIWLFWRHPKEFARYKRAFLLSGAIGLTIFYVLPTAPPRLADQDLFDTVTTYSNAYRVLQPPALTNQYAAMPSLHVGWNLLIGIALARNAVAWPPRWLGWLSPLAMALAAVATANHFVLDIVAGVAVSMFALWVVTEREHASGRRRLAATEADVTRASWLHRVIARSQQGGVPVGDDAVHPPADELVEASPVVDRPAEQRRGELAQSLDARGREHSLVDGDAVRDPPP